MKKLFYTVEFSINRRTPEESKIARKEFDKVKRDFLGICSDEICDILFDRERQITLCKLRDAHIHHIAPILLGGHPTDYENLAVVTTGLHNSLHKIIRSQYGLDVTGLPRFAGKIWIPNH